MAYIITNESQPYSVAIGDIDNDNDLDLVVADYLQGVTVFLGDGNGTFALMRTYSPDMYSYLISLTLADFNDDNHLDIAFTNMYHGSFDILLGYGNGTYAASTRYSTGTGSEPYYVITADFNSDNISDIAVTNFGANEVVILYGYGNGSFELVRTCSTGFSSKPYGITVADLNNDTHLEIIVVLWGTGDVAVLTEYCAAQFSNQTIYLTGSTSQPFSVVVADLNNDNRSDIIVANSGTDDLDILFSSSFGTFDTEMTYSIDTDPDPQYVITCDINNDNHLDLITANSKSNSISVILGHGNGSFAKQEIYSTGDNSHPYAVASDDMNNDHYMDIVVVNEGTNSIGIFYGFNYSSFQNQGNYSIINWTDQAGIVVGDFNNDNYLDIATAFRSIDALGVLFGHGNGSFSDIIIYSTGDHSGPIDVTVGDFNNDNQSDIVVTIRHNIGVFIGYGNGSFAPMITSSTTNDLDPVFLVDAHLNNDNYLDIVVTSSANNNLGILLGYGNGTFFVENIYSTGENSYPHAVAVGHFNNDSQLDIVVANYGADNLGILLECGNGSFDTMKIYSMAPNSFPFWATVADFNGDHRLDIATTIYNLNYVGILLGYGNGTFAVITTYPMELGSNPLCLHVGDFNNDNNLDLAVTNFGNDNIRVLFGTGDGTFLLGRTYSTGNTSSPFALATGDFNNDNRLDIAVTSAASNNIRIFLGDGPELLGSMITYQIDEGSKPHSIAIGDVNNDGRQDIVLANYGKNSVDIILGLTNEDFIITNTYSTGSGSAPYSLALADFNDDHYLDIVVTNSGSDNIAILLGFGNGSFVIVKMYSTGIRSAPYSVTVGDLDNDKKLDIALVNSGTSQLFLLYGNGNGTFGNETTYALGYGYYPYSIVVKDLNEDNWLDIVIACYGANHVEIFIKTC